MATTSQADMFDAWELAVNVASGSTDPAVPPLVFQLEQALQAGKSAQEERFFHNSKSQQASRNMEQALTNGNEAYSRLRRLLQALHGVRAETLTMFGFRPLRPATKTQPKTIPPEQVQSTAQEATPAADSTTSEGTNQ
ncbi:MAG TPA: hypothetical protein VE078_20745 [Thermoanaerobaculia bacterium]|nr:hypothetical protein [Thermoanaerobaculia bacterium]